MTYQVSEFPEPPQDGPSVILTNDLDGVLDVSVAAGADHAEGLDSDADAAEHLEVVVVAPSLQKLLLQLLLLKDGRGFVELPLQDVDLALVGAAKSRNFALTLHPLKLLLLEVGFGADETLPEKATINLLNKNNKAPN